MARVTRKKMILFIGGTFLLAAMTVILLVFLTARQYANTYPSYDTVLPDGKTIEQLGGWTRVSPPEGEPVYAFADVIEEVPVSVSQQPLPTNFESGADNQVAELAKKFNATAKIESGQTIIYIGTSAQGPQSVIFTKNDLLILIKSQKEINYTAWAQYVTALN